MALEVAAFIAYVASFILALVYLGSAAGLIVYAAPEVFNKNFRWKTLAWAVGISLTPCMNTFLLYDVYTYRKKWNKGV
jgi:divalent metal cation (Fe/Co/Zn/Cd) transporter